MTIFEGRVKIFPIPVFLKVERSAIFNLSKQLLIEHIKLVRKRKLIHTFTTSNSHRMHSRQNRHHDHRENQHADHEFHNSKTLIFVKKIFY